MALRYRAAKNSDQRRAAAIGVTIWAGSILQAGDHTVVKVAHPHCGNPDCGDDATTVLLLRPDRPTSVIRINKSLETVTEADLRAALLPVAHAQREGSDHES